MEKSNCPEDNFVDNECPGLFSLAEPILANEADMYTPATPVRKLYSLFIHQKGIIPHIAS